MLSCDTIGGVYFGPPKHYCEVSFLMHQFFFFEMAKIDGSKYFGLRPLAQAQFLKLALLSSLMDDGNGSGA